MLFIQVLNHLVLLGAAFATRIEKRECTAEYRETTLGAVAPAFSYMTPGAAATLLKDLPLKPTCQLILYINGAPGITVGQDASSTRDVALTVRQIVYQIQTVSKPPVTDDGNGTTHTEYEITTGLLHVIAVPVDIHAGVNLNFDLADCQIQAIVGILTIPSSVLGIPVDLEAIVQQIQDVAAV